MKPDHPVDLVVPAPLKSSRLLALATLVFMVPKFILVLPHIVVLYFVMIAALFVAFAGQIVVLFTGKYPVQMHEFVAGALRWQIRMNAYLLGLRDEYPPFSLK